MEHKNYGVIFEHDPRDFVAGSETALTYDYEVEDWTDYLVLGERQRRGKLETMACVSFSALSALEMHFQYLIRNNKITPENWKWLNDNGYILNGELNLSDRFTAKMSGTNKDGNTGSAVAYSMYKHGVVPESKWEYKDGMTWEEFYTEIPQEVKDLGIEWTKRFSINYERVHHYTFDDKRKNSPLQVYAHAWSRSIINGVYQKTVEPINHAILDFKKTENRIIFDTYEPFLKKLAPNYMFYAWGYSYKVTQNTMGNNFVKILKDKDSKAVGYFVPAINEDALKSLSEAFQKPISIKDGQIDWESIIEGEFTLKQ